MEAIGIGLEAIGHAAGAWAAAFGWIYVVGILTKSALIFMDKLRPEDTKDWFKFWNKSGGL